MKTDHPEFTSPANHDTPLWRYMGFTKYVAILQHNALFFPRADKLGDPFEGSVPLANKAVRETRWKERIPTGYEPRGGWECLLAEISQRAREARPWHVVSCWHQNEHESAAMWALYGGQGAPICIRTTFRKLRAGLSELIPLGVVHYIDYDTHEISEWNGFTPYVHKRASYAHEQEVRAVLWLQAGTPFKRDSPPEIGVWIPVDLGSLIEGVLVAPASPDWLADLVRDVTARYGFHFGVQHSRLDGEAFF